MEFLIYLLSLVFFLPSAEHLDKLHSQYGNFYDSAGRTVILHGVNEVNRLKPYYPGADSNGFDERNIEFLEHHGFNVIRLGVFWQGIEPSPPKNGVATYDDNYLKKVKQTIDLLAKHHIYTMIDFHEDAFSNKHGGFGSPSWAALGRGPWSNTINVGFPENLFGGAYIQKKYVVKTLDKDFDHFWQNDKSLQDNYVLMVGHVVKYFQHSESVIGYDLMNEPSVGSDWNNCMNISPDGRINIDGACKNFDVNILTPFYKNIMTHIHDINPSTITFYEPSGLFGLAVPTAIADLQIKDGKNLGFSFHNYYSPNFDLALNAAQQQKDTNNSALLMSEFGASSVKPEQISTLLDKADQKQISWMVWTYSNNPAYKFSAWPSGLPDDPSKQGIVYDPKKFVSQQCKDYQTYDSKCNVVNWNELDALDRPYPQYIAGHNIEFHFDETKDQFTLTYTAPKKTSHTENKNAQITQIYLPVSKFKNSYIIKTQGATRIPSPKGSRSILKFKNDTADHMITITITTKKNSNTQL